jgi:hypothetical protein
MMQIANANTPAIITIRAQNTHRLSISAKGIVATEAINTTPLTSRDSLKRLDMKR